MGATPVLGRWASPGPFKVLADDEVRYVGDPYAMVVAESRALAEDAVELIELDVEPLPPVVDYTTGARRAPSACTRIVEGNVAGGMPMPPSTTSCGRILETAPHVVTDTFVQNRYLAVPMETRGIVAWWDPRARLVRRVGVDAVAPRRADRHQPHHRRAREPDPRADG